PPSLCSLGVAPTPRATFFPYTPLFRSAEALGMSRRRIIARHILPNTLSFVIVAATVTIPGYILAEVALSFLGVGVQEPSASWGKDRKSTRLNSSHRTSAYAGLCLHSNT